MLGVGPDLHLGRGLDLHAAQRCGGRQHPRPRQASPPARQLRGGAVDRQGDAEAAGHHHRQRQDQDLRQGPWPAPGHADVVGERDPVRGAPQHPAHLSDPPDRPPRRRQGVFLQVQRPDLCQDGEAGRARHARLRPQHRPGADGVQGVRDRDRRRVCVQGGPLHRPMRDQAHRRSRKVRQGARGPHRDQGQLRGAGGHHCHPRHFPQVPQQV
mmetsp:Transcript_47210/g.111316  ORF Transcript_47210/g.111316 Transcript_47210/m.111316 type:complete len:212 (-) Transcript_47210:1745-2380(-)